MGDALVLDGRIHVTIFGSDTDFKHLPSSTLTSPYLTLPLSPHTMASFVLFQKEMQHKIELSRRAASSIVTALQP